MTISVIKTAINMGPALKKNKTKQNKTKQKKTKKQLRNNLPSNSSNISDPFSISTNKIPCH